MIRFVDSIYGIERTSSTSMFLILVMLSFMSAYLYPLTFKEGWQKIPLSIVKIDIFGSKKTSKAMASLFWHKPVHFSMTSLLKTKKLNCTMLQKLSKCQVKAWLCWNLMILQPLRFYVKFNFGEFKQSINVIFGSFSDLKLWIFSKFGT